MGIMSRQIVWLVCLLIFLLCQTRLTEAQLNTYGRPEYCLFSRVDEFSCVPRFPRRTNMPNSNFFGNYTTRITMGSSGRPVCQIRVRNHRVRPLPILGNDERVKFIFSPGVRLDPPQRYGNQQYVLYNISCPPGHLAFFNLTNINMERQNCRRRRGAPQLCRDYVRIARPGFGVSEGCGSKATDDNMNQLEGRDLSVLFRTSDSRQFTGFQATVICFRREDADQDGCTRPGGGEEMTTDPGRRRRSLDEFHRGWKRQLRRMRRRRRQAQISEDVRDVEINVPFGVRVDYSEQTLFFVIEDEELPFREPIGDVILLSTFDANGTSMFFQGEAPTSIFRGPGPLAVVHIYAYFQLFAIDPRGIFPNPEEMVAIGNLTDAQYSLVTEDNSTRLSEEELNPECPNPGSIGLPTIPTVTLSPNCVRSRRQTEPERRESDMLDDNAILTAIENEFACNPVLRTSARATIALVERDDPDRLRRLRDSTTTGPPPATT